jgi:hypothetical protein
VNEQTAAALRAAVRAIPTNRARIIDDHNTAERWESNGMAALVHRTRGQEEHGIPHLDRSR